MRTYSIEAFDYHDDGSIMTLQDTWNKFRIEDSSEFVEIPALAVLALMFTIFIFHILASSFILKLTSNMASLCGFYTIISPPLYYDWDFFYRQCNKENDIVKCWKRQA